MVNSVTSVTCLLLKGCEARLTPDCPALTLPQEESVYKGGVQRG